MDSANHRGVSVMRERRLAFDILTMTLVGAMLAVMMITPADLHAAIAEYAVPAVLVIMMGALVLGAGRTGGDS